MSAVKIFKERIIYELSLSLGLDIENMSSDDIILPDEDDPVYNAYLVLKTNLKILEGM